MYSDDAAADADVCCPSSPATDALRSSHVHLSTEFQSSKPEAQYRLKCVLAASVDGMFGGGPTSSQGGGSGDLAKAQQQSKQMDAMSRKVIILCLLSIKCHVSGESFADHRTRPVQRRPQGPAGLAEAAHPGRSGPAVPDPDPPPLEDPRDRVPLLHARILPRLLLRGQRPPASAKVGPVIRSYSFLSLSICPRGSLFCGGEGKFSLSLSRVSSLISPRGHASACAAFLDVPSC